MRINSRDDVLEKLPLAVGRPTAGGDEPSLSLASKELSRLDGLLQVGSSVTAGRAESTPVEGTEQELFKPR